MKVLVKVLNTSKIDSIIQKINRFPNVDFISKLEENYLSVYYKGKITIDNVIITKRTRELYSKLHPDIEFSMYITREEPEKQGELVDGIEKKRYHFFLDIDHTLTDNPKGEIDGRAKRAFKEMNKLGHVIHFATGRDRHTVIEHIRDFNVSPKSICEAGGIILGLTPNPMYYGHIDGPTKALTILQENFKNIEIDENQSERETEVVIKNNQDISKVVKAIKDIADAHESKRAIHLTEIGVDKGTALDRIISKSPEIDDDKVVCIGDSHLDSPMLEKAHLGVALKNSDDFAMTSANIVMSGGNFFDGVLYTFKKIDKQFDTSKYRIRYAY